MELWLGLPGCPLPAGWEFTEGLEPAVTWLFLVGFPCFAHVECRAFSGRCVLFATCFCVWFGGFRVWENILVFKRRWFWEKGVRKGTGETSVGVAKQLREGRPSNKGTSGSVEAHQQPVGERA